MCKLKINIVAPKKILKGAGYPNSIFLPAWIYKLRINIINNTKINQLTSLNIVLPNGIRFLDNLHINGPDESTISKIKAISPNKEITNDNAIIFANNVLLSPSSINILSFDIALSNNFTINSIENSGKRIPHKHELNFCAHLLNECEIYSSNFKSEALEYLVNITSENDSATPSDIIKFYIECKTGQYNMVNNVYFRNILSDGLSFVDNTSNIEPDQIYPQDNDIVLKWCFGSLKACETRKIGYKASIEDTYHSKSLLQKGDIIKNYINSNCVNNKTATQCPDTDSISINIK